MTIEHKVYMFKIGEHDPIVFNSWRKVLPLSDNLGECWLYDSDPSRGDFSWCHCKGDNIFTYVDKQLAPKEYRLALVLTL